MDSFPEILARYSLDLLLSMYGEEPRAEVRKRIEAYLLAFRRGANRWYLKAKEKETSDGQ